MGDVVDFQNYMPHYPLEAMCMKCLDRWIAVIPSETVLKTVECKQCGTGYVIDTGQYIRGIEYSEPAGEAS